MHPLIEIGIILAGAYFFFVAFALLSADRVLFQARRSSYRDGPRITKVIADDGVAISALHLRATPRRGVILYLHGNAEDLGDILQHIEAMHQRGYSILAIDYRGYGTTPGNAGELNVIADAAAALRHLCVVEAVTPNDVILYGRSMGGGPAVELAVRQQLGGLVLDGAFTSAFRVVTGVPLIPFDRFRNVGKLAHVRCPVLVIHGTVDRTVPFGHGPRLFRAAPEGSYHVWVAGAGHNNLVEVAGETYWSALERLAAQARRRSR